MSISEKLISIAENQKKVYDAGYAAGQANGGGPTETFGCFNCDSSVSKSDLYCENCGCSYVLCPDCGGINDAYGYPYCSDCERPLSCEI